MFLFSSTQSARKPQCPFVSTRRQPKPVENNESPLALDSAATQSNDVHCVELDAVPAETPSTSISYSKSMLLQIRRMSKESVEAKEVKMHPVAELPDFYQTPDWKQRNPAKPADDTKIAASEESFLNNVHMLLGKLAYGNFSTLLENLISCGVNTPGRLNVLMTEVFDTAAKHQPLLHMYADFCETLSKDARISSLLAAASDSFPQLLLRQCQNFITNLLLPRSDEEALEKMRLEEVSLHRKQQALGYIKLIGHLLIKHMMASHLFVDWAGELLAKRDSCPEALESLAAFLMVAGPEFDSSSWEHYPRLQEIIAAIRKVAKSKSTPSRARFILKDVLDARDAGWLNSKENRNIHNPQSTDAACAAESKPVASSIENDTPLQPADKLDVSLFDVVAFRRILASVLADLITSQDVAAAVNRVRLQQVPVACQVQQTADVLTRIVEEKRGPHRRRAMAFAVGLVASEQRAFDRKMFLDGLGMFFRDVYEDLCHEVPRLASMISTELVPVLLGVYAKAELNSVMPPGLYCPSLRS